VCGTSVAHRRTPSDTQSINDSKARRALRTPAQKHAMVACLVPPAYLTAVLVSHLGFELLAKSFCPFKIIIGWTCILGYTCPFLMHIYCEASGGNDSCTLQVMSKYGMTDDRGSDFAPRDGNAMPHTHGKESATKHERQNDLLNTYIGCQVGKFGCQARHLGNQISN
jgi:hypothetical protein